MHFILRDYAAMKANERLAQARKAAGFETAQDAAAALGVKYPTYAGHENGARDFTRSAGLYARRFNTTIDWLLTGKPDRPVTVQPPGHLPERSASLTPARIVGTVKASYWQDVSDHHEYEEGEFVPSASNFPPEWQYAYEVDGPSVNKVAKDGDILVCVDLIQSMLPVEENDLVIVERTRYGGAMLERTAKRVRRTMSGFELWPDSTDPDFQEPIPMSSGDDNEVRIRAKVIWIVRKP